MKADLADLLARLPGKVTPQWPGGERFTPDFVTWVVFWGPPGGEGEAAGG